MARALPARLIDDVGVETALVQQLQREEEKGVEAEAKE